MQKLSFALSVLALPFAFHSVQSQAAQTKTGTATISGRVSLKGEPARGVTVILYTENRIGPYTMFRARADESGRYQFSGVVAGRCMVIAVAPGYVSEDDTDTGRRGKTLVLADGENVENVNLEIKPGGVISGKVTDSKGRPVIEESVHLTKLDANNRPLRTFFHHGNYDVSQTDDRGFYRIYGLMEGRYLVSVGRAEITGSVMVTSRREFYPRVFYPNVSGESQAKAIDVSEGSEISNIDITVSDPKQTYDVYGRVVDAGNGKPVAGLEVVVSELTKDGRYAGGYSGSGSRSRQNGEFRIIGLAPGKYAVLTRYENAPSGFISDPAIVEIGKDTVTGVEIKVRQGASISGDVVIEGTNDPKIRAKLPLVSLGAIVRSTSQPPAPFINRYDRVNADGSFNFRGLPPGKVTISAHPSFDARDLVMLRVERNGEPVSGGIGVEAGEQVTGVRVILVHGSLAIRGELRIVGGPAPANLRFFVSSRNLDLPGASFRAAEVDARGRFVIENLPPGEYDISVTPFSSSNGQSLSPEIRNRIASSVERVILSAGLTPPVVFTLNLNGKERDQ